jgi:two-component system NtrC family sensor kinase
MRQSIKKSIVIVIFFMVFAQFFFVFAYFQVLKDQLKTSWERDKTIILKILADRLSEEINLTQSKIRSLVARYRSLDIDTREILWRITGDMEHITACGYYDTKGRLIFQEARLPTLESIPKSIDRLNWEDEVLNVYSNANGESYLNLKVFDMNSNIPLGFIVCSLNIRDLLKEYTHAYGIQKATIRLLDSQGVPVLVLNQGSNKKQLSLKTNIKNANMSIELREPEDYVYKNAYDFLKLSLLLSFALCGGLFLIGFFTVRRIFKPLEDLKLSVINWAEKKNIEVKGYGEVYILARAFQNLLDSLEKEKRVYMNLFNNLGDALLLVENEKGIIEMVNSKFLDMFGIRSEDVVGLNVKEISPQLTLGSFTFIPESLLEIKGKSRYASIASIPIDMEEKSYTLFHIKDITDKKNLEFLINRYSRLAIVGEIACSLAHQLNNPLASIMGYTEYIKSVADEKELKDMADVVLKNAERVKNTVKRLLYIAKNCDGSPEEIDPFNFTKDLLDIINFKARKKGVVIELSANVNNKRIFTYPWKLEQILLNIIDNAIDASPMQGKVYINIEEMNSFLVWRIRDEGPGIPSEEVFSPFYTSKENGFGLGLAIAKRFVEEMGGKIEYENLHKGCEVRVYIKKGDGSYENTNS